MLAAGMRVVIEMPEALQQQVLRSHFLMGALCGAMLVLVVIVGLKRGGGS